MAFTTTHTPALIQPVYSPIIYRTTSNISSANGYKYVYKTEVDGVVVSTIKSPAAPDGSGTFNVAPILQNYITRIAQPTLNNQHPATGQVIKYRVEFGEEALGGIVTAVTNQATVVTLAIANYTTNALHGKEVSSLILAGLTLSASTYFLKYNAGLYELYSDSALKTAITATGTFSANGFIQTTDNIITPNTKVIYTSAELLAIDCYLDYASALSWSGGAAYTLTSNTKKFLTTAPTTKYVTLQDFETIGFLQDYSSNVAYFEVTGYSAPTALLAGIALGTDIITNTRTYSYNSGTGVITNYNNVKLNIGIAPQNLLLQNPSSIVFNPFCSEYTIQAFNSADVAVSELRTYKLYEHCNKYEYVRLAWLNQLGSYDYYTFKLKTEQALKIERATYKKNLTAHSYSVSDRGETNYNVQADRLYQIATDFVDTDTANWLQTLFLTADVYVVSSTGALTPIIITNETYNYKIKGTEKLKQYKIEYKHSNKLGSNV